MRVAIDLTALLPLRTGVDTYMTGLVRALSRIDEETEYTIFLNREDRALFSLPANFAVVAASRRPRVARLAFQQAILPLAATLKHVDVVHSPSFIMPLWRAGAAHVLSVHDVTSFTRPECHTFLRRSPPYRAAVRVSVHRANAVVVPSVHVHAELTRVFPTVDPSHVHVIPYGIDARFRVRAPRLSGELRLPSRYVLYVGTLEPRKNLVALLRAYEQLVGDGVAEDLVLAGKLGWDEADLRRALEVSNASHRVHLTGYVADELLPSLYAGASAFVYPSLEEGFGFPPLEAMATGIPTIATGSSSLAEHLGGAAELVETPDAAALADALRRVLRDDELRAQLRAAGLARAASFTWEAAARETRARYELLANARATSRARRARARAR